MKHFGTFFFLLLLATSVAFTGNGGSTYSLYGLGDLQYYGSNSFAGMSGTGLAYSSPLLINSSNPALWTPINRVRISFNGLYEGYASSDYQASGYFVSTRFNGIMLAIPVMPKYGIVLSGGAVPYSLVDYHVISSAKYADSVDYSIHQIGEGGLTQAYAGFSVNPTDKLSLGIKIDYYFGTIHHKFEQNFGATSYTTAAEDRLIRFNGIGATVGLLYSGLGSMFNLPEKQSLNLAVVASTTANLTAVEERYYTYTTTYTSYDTLIGADDRFHLPLRFSAGLAFQSDRFSLASDILLQKWTDATYNGSTLSSIRDSYRWSLGAEIVPVNYASRPVSQRLAFQAGVYYDGTYYRIKGININEYGASLGIALPVFAESRLALAAQYGLRGTTDQQLQKDHILRFTIMLNIGELWFVKPQEE